MDSARVLDAALTGLLAARPEAFARPLRSFEDLADLLSEASSVNEAVDVGSALARRGDVQPVTSRPDSTD